MTCSRCAGENPADAQFCEKCGAKLDRACPSCGAVASPDARFCKRCGQELGSPLPLAAVPKATTHAKLSAAPDQPASDVIDGERKTVTALFADIKGSMELMEDLDPEEARAIVDPALKLMIDAVHRYDGYIVQSTGDGIFALFGAPVAHEDHPQRALYAAMRMQEDIRRYAAKLRAAGNLPIEARVGVNTGEVVVRSIATSEGHAEYTPIGHSTSLAARMQALAPTGSVAATQKVRKLCDGFFVFKDLGPASVKGVAGQVNVFEVVGLGLLRTRLQASVRRGLTKFVGRQAELEQMKHALELAIGGHGQIVAAIGEPGVGKSRLFFEFKAVAQSGCLVLEAYSVSHGKASAYLPVIDLLHSYFEIGSEDEPRKRREKINGKVLTLERSLEDTLPYLLGLLGLVEGADPLSQMDPQIKRRRTLEAIKRILLRESLNQPLMVMFEDLHWIDEETQALLNVLADGIANSRILMLVNYRPEYTHTWGNKTYYTQLRLDPLGKESAEEMLAALLVSPAPADASAGVDRERPLADIDRGELRAHDSMVALKRLIIEKTEGNPFFMEEIVQALFEQGALAHDGVVTLVKPLAELKIPPTVEAILASRVDRLAAVEKDLLQTLAVIGKEFPLPLVQEATDRRNDELERMLRNLQLGEFIYEQPAFPDPEYSFKHALTQEVAYNSVLSERRRMLHGRIGAALEKLYADQLEDHLAELAHHFGRSADTAKAVEYLLKAGENAVQRSAMRDARERFEQGLSLLESLPPGPSRDQRELAIRAALHLPTMLVRGPTVADVEANLRRAQELCDQGNAPTRLVLQVLYGLFSYYFFVANFEMALSLAGQILALGEERGDQIITSSGQRGLGLTRAFMGEYRAATTSLERSIAIGESVLPSCQEPLLGYMVISLISCRWMLSEALWMLGYPGQALRQIELFHRLPRNLCGSFEIAISMEYDLLTGCQLIRDYTGAREKAESLSALTKENGFSSLDAYAAILLGHVAVERGAIQEGIQDLLYSSKTLKAAGEITWAQWANVFLAQAFLTAGRPLEGLTAANEAIAAANQLQFRINEAELHRLKGELLLLAGAPEGEAEASMRRAITIAQRQEAKGWELRAATNLARLLRKQGRIAEARGALAPVYNWFTEGFDTADLEDAKALLEELGA